MFIRCHVFHLPGLAEETASIEIVVRSIGQHLNSSSRLAACNASHYNPKRVIKSFRHKGLKRLFETGDRRGVSAVLADRLRRQLDVLNRARSTADINLPGYRLHRLKGDRAGIVVLQ